MSRVRDLADNNVVFVDGITTADITEHTNLFFTNARADARADARLALKMVDEDNMSSNSAAHMPTQQSVKVYVDTEVASLVDSSPSTLDTLNELAAALGDDANFSTTVTNSIATKLPLAGGTLTGNLIIDPSAAGAAVLGLERIGAANQWKIAQGHTATDYLEILEGSSTRLTIKNGGNVGIGTTNPSDKLHVNGTVKVQGAITSALTSSGGTFLSISHSGNENWSFDAKSGSGSTDYVDFGIAGGTRCMTWQEDGNVGIGEINPAEKLEVSGNIKLDTGATQYIDFKSGTSGAKNYRIYNGIGWNSDALLIYNHTDDSTILTIEPGKLGINRGASSLTQAFEVNGGAWISGNVGIGTDAPADKMHIYNSSGTTVFRADVNSNSTVGLEINKTGLTTQSWKIADGVTHNGALQFYDSTNSAVRIHLKSDGLIGIGTTSPLGTLHLHSADTALRLTSSQGSNTPLAQLQYSGSGGYFLRLGDSSNNEDVMIRTYGNSHFNGGNVGIGRTSPATKLHVADSTTNAYSSTITKGSNHSGLTLVQNDGMTGVFFATGGSGAGSHWSAITGSRSSGSDWATQLNFYTHPSATSNLNDANQRMIITGDGNVGIGETSPLGKLHVKTADSGATADASADEFVIEGSGNTGMSILSGATSTGSIYFGDSGTNWDGYIAYSQNDRKMTLGVAAGGGSVNISSVGNVGIGTANPTEKLHVEGVIRADGYDTDSITSYNITGSYSAGTEYVFTTRSQLNGLGYGSGFYKFLVWSDTFHAGTSHYQCYTPYDEFYHNNYGSNTNTVQTINYGVSMGHAPNTSTRAIDIRLRHKYGADATYPANQTFTFIPVNGFTNLNGNSGYHLRIYLFKVA